MSATQEEGEREEEGESASLKTTEKSRKRAAEESFSEVNRKQSVPVSYSFQYCFSNIWFQLLKGDFQGTYKSASVPVLGNLPDEKTMKEIPLHQLDTFSLLDFIKDFVCCGQP